MAVRGIPETPLLDSLIAAEQPAAPERDPLAPPTPLLDRLIDMDAQGMSIMPEPAGPTLDDRIALHDQQYGTLEQFGIDLVRGAENVRNAIDAIQLQQAGSMFHGEPPPAAAVAPDPAFDQLQATAPQKVAENAQALAQRTAMMQENLPQRPVLDALTADMGLGEILDTLGKDPLGAMAGVTAESLPAMLPGILAGPVGVVPGAAGFGVGSGTVEFGGQLMEVLQRNGVDLNDAAAVEQAIMQNPELVSEMAGSAARKALPIAAVDTASAGLASKFLAPARMAGTLPGEAANLATQQVAQAAAGGAGEAAGQLAEGGEISDLSAIVLEMVGEGATAPVEVASLGGQAAIDRLRAPKLPPVLEQALAEEPVAQPAPEPLQEPVPVTEIEQPTAEQIAEPLPQPEPEQKGDLPGQIPLDPEAVAQPEPAPEGADPVQSPTATPEPESAPPSDPPVPPDDNEPDREWPKPTKYGGYRRDDPGVQRYEFKSGKGKRPPMTAQVEALQVAPDKWAQRVEFRTNVGSMEGYGEPLSVRKISAPTQLEAELQGFEFLADKADRFIKRHERGPAGNVTEAQIEANRRLKAWAEAEIAKRTGSGAVRAEARLNVDAEGVEGEFLRVPIKGRANSALRLAVARNDSGGWVPRGDYGEYTGENVSGGSLSFDNREFATRREAVDYALTKSREMADAKLAMTQTPARKAHWRKVLKALDEAQGVKPKAKRKRKAKQSDSLADAPVAAVESQQAPKRPEVTTAPSVNERVYEDLGLDPARARLMPADKQFQQMSSQIKKVYGFKAFGKTKGLQYREALDHAMDGYENLHNLAAGLGLPPRAVSLDGQLSVQLVKNARWYGVYVPAMQAIGLRQQSDSFSHEWMHAVDFELQKRASSSEKGAGLAQVIRKGGDTPGLADNVANAYVRLLNAIFLDEAATVAQIKDLETKIAKTKSEKQKAALQGTLDRILAGAFKPRNKGKLSEFYKRAQHSNYLKMPTELIARSGEAYVSWKIQSQMGAAGTEFLGRTDTLYSDKADEEMRTLYPQDKERVAIFEAWDRVFAAVAEEEYLAKGEALKLREPVKNLGIFDPIAHAQLAGVPVEPEQRKASQVVRAAIDKELSAWGPWWTDTKAKLSKAAADGELADMRRELGLAARQMLFTPAGVFEHFEKAYAKDDFLGPRLRRFRDLFSDEHIFGRDKPTGIFREIDAEQRRILSVTDRRLTAVGITDEMPAEWNSLMWDALTGQEPTLTDEQAKQAAQIRYDLDRGYKKRRAIGQDVGYVANGYLPHRITNHTVLSRGEQLRDALIRLRTEEIERSIEQLEQEQQDLAADSAEYKKLQKQIDQLRKMDPVQLTDRHLARMKKARWGAPIYVGVNEINVLKQRAFSELADKHLKDFYDRDIVGLLHDYNRDVIRDDVLTKRLGPEWNSRLDEMLVEVGAKLTDTENQLLRYAVAVSLDTVPQQTWGAAKTVLNFMSSGIVSALLGRAFIPSLPEPTVALLRSLSPTKDFTKIVTRYTGLFNLSADARENMRNTARWGRLMGVFDDANTRAMILQRQFGEADNLSAGLRKAANNFFVSNLLMPLTNWQRQVELSVGLEAFYDAAGMIVENPEGQEIGVYKQFLTEHGVPRGQVDAFAKWLVEQKELPINETFDLSENERLLRNAAVQFIDTTIQSPTPSTKLLISKAEYVGFIARITAFLTTNYRNTTKNIVEQVKTAATGKRGEARLTPTQRATIAALPVVSMLYTLMMAHLFLRALRMTVFDAERWEEWGEDFWERTVSGENMASAFSALGLFSIADLGFNWVTQSRITRPATALAAGPFYGTVLDNLDKIKEGAIDEFFNMIDDPRNGTNNAEYEALRAAYALVAGPAALMISSLMPNTMVGHAIRSTMAIYGTSPQASHHFATMLVGEKDAHKKNRKKALRSWGGKW